MWDFLITNQIFLFALGIVAAIVIIYTLNKITKSNIMINTKEGIIKTYKNDKKVVIPERRNMSQYFYYMEKVNDCDEEIRKLEDQLENKQFDVFRINFKFIYSVIINEFRDGFIKWASEKNKPIPDNFDKSIEFLEYKLIIKEITEENIINIQNYVKDNDLWRYSNNEWIEYKKNNSKKYRNIAIEKFKILYSPNICKIPVSYHNIHILKPGDKKLKEIIDKMQNELRNNSIKFHERIIEIKKMKSSYMQFKEYEEN